MSGKIKTYYGEYSLDHWIKLIKSSNIKMPEYQREFVWKTSQILELYNSLKKDLFIPPVVIVRAKKDGKEQNFVLDGQQRLTSIVLIKNGKYPVVEGGKTFWDDWDNLSKPDLYKHEEKFSELGDVEFKNKSLGFSFILITEEDENKANEYFADVFHIINSNGINLTYEQKLRALKFVAINFEKLIYPDKLKEYKVNNKKIDLIRYLAFLYIFNNENRESELVSLLEEHDLSRGDQIPTSLLEKIYYDFIKSLSSDKGEIELFKGLKGHFEQISNEELETKLEELVEFLDGIGLEKYIDNVYLADLYLFGLVNYLFFENKLICLDWDDAEEINRISNDFLKKIDEISDTKVRRSDMKTIHTNKPNTFNYIKARVEASIELYKSVDFDGEEV